MGSCGHLFLDELDTARSSLLARMRISARFLSRSWVSLETRRYPTVLDGFSGTICSRSMETPLSLINDIVSFDLFNAMHCTISKECKGLVGWLRRRAGGFEEAPTHIGNEVLAAAGVDDLEIADQARYFALRTVRSGPSASSRKVLHKFEKRRDRALPDACGGSEYK